MNYKKRFKQKTRDRSLCFSRSKGPAHDQTFTVEVYLDDICLGRGEGKTKKFAEQEAARHALEKKAI